MSVQIAPARIWDGTQWVISKPPFVPVTATGGTVSTVTINGRQYRLHQFTSVGSFTFAVSNAGDEGVVDYLIVGGGGGGGRSTGLYWGGSGGGAGGYLRGRMRVLAQNYTVVVGAGGAASTFDGNNGNPSSITNDTVGDGVRLVADGGGRGRTGTGSGLDYIARPGGNGGSGGGAAGAASAGGTATLGQGRNGGAVPSGTSGNASGGGAGGVGLNHISAGRLGGPGLNDDITGTSVGRAGGGSAAPYYGGIGSVGFGGGTGGTTGTRNGDPNTGGGGGGCNDNVATSGAGGSGVVIIRYPLEAA